MWTLTSEAHTGNTAATPGRPSPSGPGRREALDCACAPAGRRGHPCGAAARVVRVPMTVLGRVWSRGLRHPVAHRTRSGGARLEPFRWRRALFLGLVSSAASLAAPVVETFVSVWLQAGIRSGTRRPAGTSRLADVRSRRACPPREPSSGSSPRRRGTHGACTRARFLAVCLSASCGDLRAVAPPSAVGRWWDAGAAICTRAQEHHA